MQFRNIIKCIALLVLILNCVQLAALPYRIDTIVRKLPNKKEQLIHLISDAHIDQDLIWQDSEGSIEINKKELKKFKKRLEDVISVVQQKGVSKTTKKVIIESMYVDEAKQDLDVFGRLTQQISRKLGGVNCEDIGAFLFALPHKLTQNRIAYDNVEFRYDYFLRAQADELTKDEKQKFLSAWQQVTVQDFIDSMKLEKILTYHDGPVLTPYYVKIVEKQKKFYKQYSKNCIVIKDFFENNAKITFYDERGGHARDISFDRRVNLNCLELIDIHILHAIHQADQDDIFVFAGGVHCENVRNKLLEDKEHYELFATAGLEVSSLEVARLFRENKIAEIKPVNITRYFERDLPHWLMMRASKKGMSSIIDDESTPQSNSTKYLLAALATAGIAALLYYNWPTVTNIWQSILGSSKMQINSPTLTAGGA